ncbi:methyltransferase domain-containing protein [Streptomyces sp. NPDC059970]|uniref:methyltransferase domain-containing protein n=1 Tax=Streptomyces sp. NPDC059970 TaxID=3347019 RepID=UPI0036C8F6EC
MDKPWTTPATTSVPASRATPLATLLDTAERIPGAAALRHHSYELLRAGAGTAVVDIGCGTGTAVAELTALGARAIGADLDARMVAVARERLPGADIRTTDAYALPFPDHSLHGYRADKVLHALADPAAALREREDPRPRCVQLGPGLPGRRRGARGAGERPGRRVTATASAGLRPAPQGAVAEATKRGRARNSRPVRARARWSAVQAEASAAVRAPVSLAASASPVITGSAAVVEVALRARMPQREEVPAEELTGEISLLETRIRALRSRWKDGQMEDEDYFDSLAHLREELQTLRTREAATVIRRSRAETDPLTIWMDDGIENLERRRAIVATVIDHVDVFSVGRGRRKPPEVTSIKVRLVGAMDEGSSS